MSTVPLSKRRVDELLQDAAKYQAMAADARSLAVVDGLLRLAARLRELARRRVGAPVQQPGEPATETGLYRQLDIFGSRTGATIDVRQCVPLPSAPDGFTWCLGDDRQFV